MAEGVAADGFVDTRQPGRSSDRSLRAAFTEVVAASNARAGVYREFPGGEEVLPAPLAVGVGVLSFERGGEVNRAVAVGQVLLVEHSGASQLFLEGFYEAIGEYRDPIFHPLAVAHDDEVLGKVNIFDPQAQAF